MVSQSQSAGSPNMGSLWRGATAAFQWETPLPRFRRVHQQFPRPRVDDIPAAVTKAMDSQGGAETLGGGRRVAITAGSRGIAGMPQVIAAVVAQVRRYGGEPFVVPAMGSHGRATAEGQVGLLADLGITPESVGAPIEATMEVVQLGSLPNGMPVYMDRIAAASDAIVVVNRVKPHTDFTGRWESGLGKIVGIGLGKKKGAETIHRYGTEGLRDHLFDAARLAVREAPIAMGIAIVENGYDDVALIVGVPPSGIAGPEEAELLAQARDLMASLPFDDIDVLLIDEMGKNVSGAGMDPNILGRMRIFGVPDRPRPRIRTVAVLDITKESHGNGTGIGLADVATSRLVEQLDFEAFYINGFTSGLGAIQRISLPVVAPSDRAAFMTALRSCGRPDTENARIVRIKNTLKLEEIEVSEALWPLVEEMPSLSFAGAPFDLAFGEGERIAPFGRPE